MIAKCLTLAEDSLFLVVAWKNPDGTSDADWDFTGRGVEYPDDAVKPEVSFYGNGAMTMQVNLYRTWSEAEAEQVV